MTVSDSVFITTSIPFVNGPPHVGFAWELILADVFARYQRLRGARVHFLTGTDDNSLKNVRAAEHAGQDTPAFVRARGNQFKHLGECLGISNDDFIQTAFDPRHRPAVEKLWRRCAAAGDVYGRAYEGLYCVGCEQFYAESELAGGRCPEHDAPLESVRESNYFFRLTRHQRHIEGLLRGRGLSIHPEQYERDAAQWLDRGLVDFSISRSRKRARGWGIGVPEDPEQIVYVWFDALTNYISALGYADDDQLFRQHWQSGRRIHVIGKNVTRFHCVYWPAILHSAGLLPPTDVVVHGFLTVGGKKIGKSLGNGVDPRKLVEGVGRDAVRYYLLRHFPVGRDGDFSIENLVEARDGELADQLGNLLSRTLALLERHFFGVIPRSSVDEAIVFEASRAASDSAEALERFAPGDALSAIFSFIEENNRRIAQTEPWKLARLREGVTEIGRRDELDSALACSLGEAARALLWTAGLLRPFLADTAERIARALGTAIPNPYCHTAVRTWRELGVGARVQRGEVLFPKHLLKKHGRKGLAAESHGEYERRGTDTRQ